MARGLPPDAKPPFLCFLEEREKEFAPIFFYSQEGFIFLFLEVCIRRD